MKILKISLILVVAGVILLAGLGAFAEPQASTVASVATDSGVTMPQSVNQLANVYNGLTPTVAGAAIAVALIFSPLILGGIALGNLIGKKKGD